MLSFSACFY